MESIVCLDSSVLIDHYRKKDKEGSFFYQLVKKYQQFNISVISEYEILIGAKTVEQINYWKNVFSDFFILNYNSAINQIALEISLRQSTKRLNIEFKDLIIASTAIQNKIPLATFNKKHFINIENLQIITPDSF